MHQGGIRAGVLLQGSLQAEGTHPAQEVDAVTGKHHAGTTFNEAASVSTGCLRHKLLESVQQVCRLLTFAMLAFGLSA